MAASKEVIASLLRLVAEQNCRCPLHSQGYRIQSKAAPLLRKSSGTSTNTEYAFELATSTIRYGPGVTRELGADLINMKTDHVGVFTDKNLVKLPPVAAVLESLTVNKVSYSLFDDVSIEPTDESFQEAIKFAKSSPNFKAFVAVGGGSVMDTAKAANLYVSHPENDFLDFVNTPIGKGLPVTHPLKPLICVPTTAGTGSETTGVAIFDFKSMKLKTGISHRFMQPTMGLIDPLHVLHMPKNVTAFSGFDVLCHALESYTALPYQQRSPCPSNPILRPAYQGSNPISDIWSKEALRTMRQYFSRAVHNSEDVEARGAMHLASVCAGVGFGNAGVHLPHGMSYTVSGLVRDFTAEGYDSKKHLIPHGLSVILSAPAVFEFTAPLCPERHLEAAQLLGTDIGGKRLEDAGKVLADTLRRYMDEMGIPNGLKALGYTSDDIPALVKGTLPQERVTKLSPRSFSEEELAKLFENSMTVYY